MSVISNPLFPGKHFISTVLEALETKTAMSGELARRYLQRAAMAGVVIGLLYATNFAIIAAFDAVQMGEATLRTLGKIAGALAFGWALVFIHYSKSELLTSNMMIVSIGAYHSRIGWLKALRLLSLCYIGNFLGGLFVALLLRFSTLTEGPVLAEMGHAVALKLAYVSNGAAGWGDLFVRAILCNFMINLAMLLVYNGLIKDDLTKSLVMIVSVFIFAFLGFEHSVANTVLFTIIGLKEGIDLGLAAGNVSISLAGNFIGGGLLIGLYYAYVNDDAKYLRTRPQAAGSPGQVNQ
jgi:formate/nitrite transporter FocA (FNT family)